MCEIDNYPPKKRNSNKNRYCRWHNTNQRHFYKPVDLPDDSSLGLRISFKDEIIVPKNRLKALDAIGKNFLLCNSNPNGTNSLCKFDKNYINKKKSKKRITLKSNCEYLDPIFSEKTHKPPKEVFTKDENCAICLDSMKNRQVKNLSCCNHSLCESCFDTFVTLKNNDEYLNSKEKYGFYSKYNLKITCPLCRNHIFQVQNNFEPYPDSDFDFDNNSVDEFEI